MGKDELKPNLAVDPALLAEAEAAGISSQSIAEKALREALRGKQAQDGADEGAHRWAEENAEGIADYNRRIRERGLIGAEFRKW